MQMKAMLDILLFFTIAYIVWMAYTFIIEPELKKKIQKELLESGIKNFVEAGKLKQDIIEQLKHEGYIIKPKQTNKTQKT